MKEKKCTVLFTGGLGNQLFQFVFMLYQKDILGFNRAEYNISSYGFQPIHSGFQADQIFNFERFEENKTNYYSPFFRILKRMSRQYKLFKWLCPIIYERDYKEDCHQIIYEGFWQKAKYYEAVKEALPNYTKGILSSFPDVELMRKVEESESVFVHVRRGDYVNNPTYCDLTEGDYYQEAITYIQKRMGHPLFFVFSDDIEWCRSYFGIREDFVFVEYNNQTPINDLALMSCCHAAIIANSSFSWWGAALGKKEIVLHSPLYFKSHGQPELYLKEWIEIKHST